MPSKFRILSGADAEPHWPAAVEMISRVEGWVCSPADPKTMHRCFPGGDFILFAAVDSATEEFLGSVFVVNYPGAEALSMIGDFMVRPETRGNGVGLALFDAAMQISKPKKFLYGVDAMREKYAAKYGFNKIPEWRLNTATVDIPNLKPQNLQFNPKLRTEPPAAVGFPKIQKYYREFLWEADGDNFIKGILEAERSYSQVAITEKGQIVGLARVRECSGGLLVVGPLLGDDALSASTALRSALLSVPNVADSQKLLIVYPDNNAETPKLLKQLSDGKFATTEFQMAAQWSHKVFNLPTERIFAISQADACIV